MKEPGKPKILIVDDVPENVRMLIEILKSEYATIPAVNGETALKKAMLHPLPDLVLLDIIMPDIDGYEVCRRLKEIEETKDIPVIFITAVSEVMDDAKGFELGAVDYVTKPFNPATVKARVKSQIKLRKAMLELKSLYKTALDSNPLTGLPGNNSIREMIQKALETNTTFVVYADLDNFKPFNDKYGFARGDEVILYTASLFKEAVRKAEIPDAFIGHIGGDDFVLLVDQDKHREVTDYIIEAFEKGVTDYYDKTDLSNGGILSRNRRGGEQRYPMMTISMGGVNLANHRYIHFLEVIDACTEVKRKAKEMTGSAFLSDRREKSGDPPASRP